MRDAYKESVPIKVRRIGLNDLRCQENIWSSCIGEGTSGGII